jgi:hypothetical protein
MFASQELFFKDLLVAICLFVVCPKGISAVQFSVNLDFQHKTAFVPKRKLLRRLRARPPNLAGQMFASFRARHLVA